MSDKDLNLSNQKEDLIDRVKELTGSEPPFIRLILKVLAHHFIIEHTRLYFESMDQSTKCQKYEAPWTCAREAEARYENIKYGWLGGSNGIGYEDWWCEPCQKKVMGT